MSADTGSLAAFLDARLDEEEAAARLAAREGGTWTQDDPIRYPGSISSLGGPVVYDEGNPDEYQAAHIARHDPARALREIKAHRAIAVAYRTIALDFTHVNETEFEFARREALEQACENLAGIWDDHPGYRPAGDWSP